MFKLLVVILALLVLHTNAQRSSNRRLADWIYNNDIIKNLGYKRETADENRADPGCRNGVRDSDECDNDDIPLSTESYIPGKRAWSKLDLVGLLRALWREETRGSKNAEIFMPAFADKPEK